MSYQDAIAGFSLLHQAFRDNADNKRRLLEQEIDNRFKSEERDKEQKFMAGENAADRANRLETTKMQVGVQYANIAENKRQFEKGFPLEEKRVDASVGLSEAQKDAVLQKTEQEMKLFSRDEANIKSFDEILKGSDLAKSEEGKTAAAIAKLLGPTEGGALWLTFSEAKSSGEARATLVDKLRNKPFWGELLRTDNKIAFIRERISRGVLGDPDGEILIEAARKGFFSFDQSIAAVKQLDSHTLLKKNIARLQSGLD